jgi:hypothetical protein
MIFLRCIGGGIVYGSALQCHKHSVIKGVVFARLIVVYSFLSDDANFEFEKASFSERKKKA